MTPADLENKSIKKLGVSQKLMLEVKPLNSDYIRHNREGCYFRRDLASVKSKEKTSFSGFPIVRTRKKGKMLTSLLQADLWEGFCSFVMSHN